MSLDGDGEVPVEAFRMGGVCEGDACMEMRGNVWSDVVMCMLWGIMGANWCGDVTEI